jgi:phosphate transport system substrate-binding protein
MRIAICCFLSVFMASWSGMASAQTPATPASNPLPVQANASEASVVPVSPDSQHLALMSLLECLELYHPAKDLQGAAKLSGSTTMMLLGKAWADRFRNFHAKVEFTRGPDGTDAGIKALAEDPTLIVGASRPITDQEIAALEAGKCSEPMSIIVALDPLALYVHESNPLTAVTPEQLESVLRAPGQKGAHIATWGELGVASALADQPIRIHARSEIAGTTAFIKQFLLRGENVAKEVGSHMSSQAVCEAIAKDTAGVGIAGFGDAVPGVRTVSLSLKGTVVPANEQSFLSGQYPLVRPLVLVFDKAQMKSDGGLRESMLRYILSRDGQMEAIRAGFFPLDPSFIHKQLDEICGTRMR